MFISLNLLIPLICLLINGYTDLTSRRTYTLVFLASYAALFMLEPNILVIGLAVITLLFNRDSNFVGGGDLDAAFLIVYAIGLSNGLKCFLVSCICAILYWMIAKDKEIPFVTMLLIGYSVMLASIYIF